MNNNIPDILTYQFTARDIAVLSDAIDETLAIKERYGFLDGVRVSILRNDFEHVLSLQEKVGTQKGKNIAMLKLTFDEVTAARTALFDELSKGFNYNHSINKYGIEIEELTDKLTHPLEGDL